MPGFGSVHPHGVGGTSTIGPYAVHPHGGGRNKLRRKKPPPRRGSSPRVWAGHFRKTASKWSAWCRSIVLFSCIPSRLKVTDAGAQHIRRTGVRFALEGEDTGHGLDTGVPGVFPQVWAGLWGALSLCHTGYPHGCGCSRGVVWHPEAGGLSPRAWAKDLPCCGCSRSIPTGVGRKKPGQTTSGVGRVDAHGCGRDGLLLGIPTYGSSPRGWVSQVLARARAAVGSSPRGWAGPRALAG